MVVHTRALLRVLSIILVLVRAAAAGCPARGASQAPQLCMMGAIRCNARAIISMLLGVEATSHGHMAVLLLRQ